MDTDRRTLLAMIGCGVVSGCLRAGDGNETPPVNETESARPTPTRTDTEGETGTEIEPDDDEPAVESPVTLNREWTAFFEPAGSSVIADEILYTGSRNGIRAIDTTDGTEQWVGKDEHRSPQPVVDSGTVYYTSFLEDGLYRIDADTGEYEAESDFGPTGGQPVVVDETVIAGTDHNSGTAGTSNELVGFTADDFSELWSVSATSTDYNGGIAAAGMAIVGFSEEQYNRIEAREPATGTVQWSVEETLFGEMAVADGTVFATTLQGNGVALLRISLSDGTIEWRHSLEETDDTSYIYAAGPTLGDENIYLASYRQLHAIDPASGESVWETETDSPLDSSPAVADGYVWVAPTDGAAEDSNEELYGFDIETGELVVRESFVAGTQRVHSIGERLILLMENQAVEYTIAEDR